MLGLDNNEKNISNISKYQEQSKSQNQKVRWQMPGVGGRELVLNGDTISVQEGKNSGDVDDGESCTTT